MRECVFVVSSGRSLHVSFPLTRLESSPKAEGMKISGSDLHNTASRQEAGKEGARSRGRRGRLEGTAVVTKGGLPRCVREACSLG